MKFLIIIVSIIGIGAVIGAVVVGTRTFDGTVVDKPYERGLSYDAVHHEKEASGWQVEILNKDLATGKNNILISVLDRNGRPATDAEVSVIVSRPSTPSYDKTYKAEAEKGQFRITAELPLYGYWDAKILVSDKARTVTFEKTLFAERVNLK
ncbi:MAG: FixH family protein [Nitrospirae bacterium]|nr:FixH family protein [Nitrospirota bacterium]